MAPSRRDLVRLALGGLAGALAPARIARAASASDRKFLFLFCAGGWDTSTVFAPAGPGSIVAVEADVTEATVGGIRFVDSAARPSVRSYFERWGGQTCIVNGIEVRSVTHERCRQLALTGSGSLGVPDWPTRLAAAATGAPALPHLVVSGPVYPGSSLASVVRVGDDGQLPDLVSGAALARSVQAVSGPSVAAAAAQDAFLRRRIAALGGADPGRAAFLGGYAGALDQEARVVALGDSLRFGLDASGCERDLVADAAVVFDAFALGASRCAMLRYDGWCGEGWDTHREIEMQSVNFEDLFRYLDGILSALDGRTSQSGGRLADEVTLVVFSEMGRAPQINAWGGKDHWTFTSCMLVGAGVRGDQVIGGYDDVALGQPIHLGTGGVSEAGVSLLPGHLGATLLALGDVDPGDIADGSPIEAALD